MESEDILGLFVSIAICVVLPVLIVWLVTRMRTNDTNKQTEIALAAIEKNPDIDIAHLLQRPEPKPQSIKERLLKKLLWAWITTIIGACFIVLSLASMIFNVNVGFPNDAPTLIGGTILLAVGVAFFVNYTTGKKLLTKEIEAEEQSEEA